MIIDAQTRFSNALALTSVGTVSSDVINLGVARDIGGAVTDQLYLLCQVVTAFTSGGSATLQVVVKASIDNSTFVTIVQSDAVAVASLVAGYKFLQNLFPSVPSSTLYQYWRLDYVVGTAAMTAGAITAGLTPSLQHSPTYGSGYTA